MENFERQFTKKTGFQSFLELFSIKMENSEFSKAVYKEWFCHFQVNFFLKMENFERVHTEEWCSVISGSIF